MFEYPTRFKSSITDFLYYWDQKDIASIVIPEGINAIEIMSIHKSKGLVCASVVIFPFANWKDDLGKDKKWFNVPLFLGQKDDEQVVTLLPLKQEIESWPKPFPQEYINHKTQVLLAH